ncbi:bifunctional aminopeptidase/epoxide hydrolase SCDLUD_002774 [Saccharomycodes ludwigii]|uniref:bifunctional aminopeptidase/epoxide hydrolase n=1 Tax=Saccharomycodes ludwigii TaxID=36035 RepID=UPI001E83701F|nr:hypothetical protein SCDLUD_002774 [Saccharomycodes ludwigii]KAH3901283.1 hypothetical protein SCDLUD_002774 [Saccharomycodes ludwigii]
MSTLITAKSTSLLPPSLENKRPKESSPTYDHSTLSNYKSVLGNLFNTDLQLSINFDKKQIDGTVTFELKSTNTNVYHLDTSYLDIHSIKYNNQQINNWSILDRVGALGSRLVIKDIPEGNSANSNKLSIDFSTTDKCTALQWLDSNQTSGKPYVFSQLEAIHARSLFPCFDTPSVKSKYTCTIKSPLPVVFSGIEKESHEKDVYAFEQTVPIPSYLIGIASGNLVSADIGPRSKVYTEPFRLKDAQWEFDGDVERFIETAEQLIFKYEWGSYNVLINPQSYPYGGMESPNMTFATPTLIAYDKSNVDVIAHELAHSWAGNLVTNCSWDHFFLNEGWTVYLERRILGAIHGDPARHFSALIGWNDLENSINAMSNPERFSKLVQDLSDGCDPDEAFSSVPYEKGFNLLFHLETKLGGTEVFDPFIKHYFSTFSKKSLDTWQFLDCLFDFYHSNYYYKNSKERDYTKYEILRNEVDWETWLFKAGMPPKPIFNTELADSVYDLVHKWKSLVSKTDNTNSFTPSPGDIKNFNSNQLVLFLDTLCNPKEGGLHNWYEYSEVVEKFLSVYGKLIGGSRNAEVIFRFFRFQVYSHNKESYLKLSDWLGTVGRMKFVRPGYRLLNMVDRSLALETFKKYEYTYHPICATLVKQDSGIGNK